MNKESILTEGFFDKIQKYFKDKKIRKKVANDPKVKSKLKDLNSSQQSLEDLLNGYLKDVKLSKYKAKDFIK